VTKFDNQIWRYLNVSIFVILSILYLSFSSQIRFSTNFIEIFFSKNSLKLFTVAKKLGYSNEIFIAKKGFDKKSLNELKEIAKKIKKLPAISKVEVTARVSNDLKDYLKKHYWLLSDFNDTSITQQNIVQRLQKIHDKIYNSFLYEPINTYDPLGLFSVKIKQSPKYIKLKDYGYVIRVKTTANTSNAMQARVIYNQVKSVISPYAGVISYAPFYFLVENSAYIKHDAQIIMGISTILLLVLYFIILKNIKLFFNAVLAIASSILGAVLLTSLFFKSISILALVFGISVTTISIDYMFHYYFHGDFSKKRFLLQKRVFFGFFTTVGVFIIFSFINIELFSQLAIFSVISLSIAYGLFSWVFVYLGISSPVVKQKRELQKSFNPLHITIISLILLAFSYHFLKFDNNLKNLDYKNEKLTKIAKLFSKGLQNDKYQGIIIKAKTKEKLLQKYEKIALDYPSLLGIGKFVYSDKKCNEKLNKIKNFNFKKIKNIINIESKKIGFKKDTFDKAYIGINHIKCNMSVIDDMKFKIIKEGDMLYTMAFIEKDKLKTNHKYFETINLAKSLLKDTVSMKSTLVKYMLISIFFIISALFFFSGINMLYPLTYLLFPVSVVLFSITIFGKINIMHIFALVILVAISIDYGIYLHKTKTLDETKMAIKYALLSTFFGFGVLIFSKTTALHSIGFVITIGIGSIFTLLYAKIPWKN